MTEMKEFQWKKQLEDKEKEVGSIRLQVISAVENAEKSIKELDKPRITIPLLYSKSFIKNLHHPCCVIEENRAL